MKEEMILRQAVEPPRNHCEVKNMWVAVSVGYAFMLWHVWRPYYRCGRCLGTVSSLRVPQRTLHSQVTVTD